MIKPENYFSNLEEKWYLRWFQFIIDHPDIEWEWSHLSRNPNIYKTKNILKFIFFLKELEIYCNNCHFFI